MKITRFFVLVMLASALFVLSARITHAYCPLFSASCTYTVTDCYFSGTCYDLSRGWPVLLSFRMGHLQRYAQ